MDGMLSQDEINALLNGMSDDTPAGSAESSSAENTADSTSAGPELLSDVEKDAVGVLPAPGHYHPGAFQPCHS